MAVAVVKEQFIPKEEEHFNHGARVCTIGPDNKLYVPVSSVEEAVRLASEGDYGLSLGIVTRDVMRGLALAELTLQGHAQLVCQRCMQPLQFAQAIAKRLKTDGKDEQAYLKFKSIAVTFAPARSAMRRATARAC